MFATCIYSYLNWVFTKYVLMVINIYIISFDVFVVLPQVYCSAVLHLHIQAEL